MSLEAYIKMRQPTREAIAEQVEEFRRRGGKIKRPSVRKDVPPVGKAIASDGKGYRRADG